MRQYGGQQLTTGAQAEVYADHFIANHLIKIGGGKTYAQLSTEAQAQPNNAKLAAVVNTVFKGETFRGLLLNAYAFGTIGMIAGIAAVVAFIGAGDPPPLVAPGPLPLPPGFAEQGNPQLQWKGRDRSEAT